MGDKMREEFEKWAVYELMSEGYCYEAAKDYLSIGLSDDYNSVRFSRDWKAWQASRDALCIELPKPFSEDRYFRDVYEVDDVLEAIHAAGVKTK